MLTRTGGAGSTVATVDCCFYSASDAAEQFRKIGLHFNILQLSQGPLEGRFRVRHFSDVVLVSLQCNQSILFQGERNKRFVTFGLEQDDRPDLFRVRGEEVTPHSIYGFNLQIRDVFFMSQAPCHFSFVLIRRERLERLSSLERGDHLMATLSRCDSAQLQPELFTRLRRMIRIPQMNQQPGSDALNVDLLEALVLECFCPSSTQEWRLLKPASFRIGLVQEIVRWGFNNSCKPISMDDLSRTVFASRSTISQSCRELFGLGPMALLKQVRLQQVQLALSSPDLQNRLACSTVQDIAAHFGFYSRNHFARDYRQLFGEAPKKTLLRAVA